eukprot:gb/GECG01005279.1/.p1 GENE.gb/GECG01005279.1/~~gb/GECG01005279.1/.p1  ORF type:complete len:516 (+),score=77.82 gb/GECG01005279.1/:1-1548(+)
MASQTIGSFVSNVFSKDKSNASYKEQSNVKEALEKGDIGKVKKILGDGSKIKAKHLKFGTFGHQSPLHVVAHRGYTELTELLLVKYGCDANARNDKGNTPVISACEAGFPDVLRVLIEKGKGDVDMPNNKGKFPLMFALPNVDLMQLLLELGKADPNKTGQHGRTPLHKVITLQKVKAIELLLKNGADPNIRDNEKGSTPLAFAVPNVSMMKLLIEQGNVDPNQEVQKGKTALHMALANENEEAVKFLLSAGANPVSEDEAGNTPLMLAFNNVTIMKHLLDSGRVDANQTTKKGKIALHEAVLAKNRQAVEILLKSGADPNLVDKNGMSALRYALPDEEYLKLLLDYGKADANQADEKGRTALHITAEANEIAPTDLLLKFGANPNAVDNMGNIPLMYSVENVTMLEKLLGYADPNQRGENGRTALHKAVIHNLESINALLRAGADPDLADKKRKNASMVRYSGCIRYGTLAIKGRPKSGSEWSTNPSLCCRKRLPRSHRTSLEEWGRSAHQRRE